MNHKVVQVLCSHVAGINSLGAVNGCSACTVDILQFAKLLNICCRRFASSAVDPSFRLGFCSIFKFNLGLICGLHAFQLTYIQNGARRGAPVKYNALSRRPSPSRLLRLSSLLQIQFSRYLAFC